MPVYLSIILTVATLACMGFFSKAALWHQDLEALC
jgi:hypothetical protein